MPNHVQTRLVFNCEKETLELIKKLVISNDYYQDGSECGFDFSKIIPFPTKEKCPAKYLINEAFNERTEWGCTNTQAHISVDEKRPYLNWYDWQRDMWGTKWNAYEVNWGTNDVWFQTAWSFAEPVVIALSKIIPNIRIDFYYADEDIGNNCNYGWCQDGVMTYADIKGEAATKFAIDLWGDEELFEFRNGEWVYKED